MIIQRILNNKNFRNGALFALFSFFNTGINFVIMMVMARFIKPDSYGQLSLFTTMVSLLSIFICLNTNGFIGVNFFSSSKEEDSTIVECSSVDNITYLYGDADGDVLFYVGFRGGVGANDCLSVLCHFLLCIECNECIVA